MTLSAVILAAGVGSRLGTIGAGKPKALMEVGGRPLIHRALDALGQAGVGQIVVATGYAEEALHTEVGGSWKGIPVAYCRNPAYATTQNAVSLGLCRDQMPAGPFFKLDGDLIFHADILERLLTSVGELRVAVDQQGPLDTEAMKVRANKNGRIEAFGKTLDLASVCGGEHRRRIC